MAGLNRVCSRAQYIVPTKQNFETLFEFCVGDTLKPLQLESEEMSRIMALCKRSHSSTAGGGVAVADMTGLMEEVNVDYLRTMNKIVLEAQTTEASTTNSVQTRSTSPTPIQ